MILFYKSCLSIFQEQWFNVKQCQCSTFSLSADPWSVQTWPSSSSLTSTLTYFLSQLLSYSKLSFIAPFPHHSSHHSLSPLLNPPHTIHSHHSSPLLTPFPIITSYLSPSTLLTPFILITPHPYSHHSTRPPLTTPLGPHYSPYPSPPHTPPHHSFSPLNPPPLLFYSPCLFSYNERELNIR